MSTLDFCLGIGLLLVVLWNLRPHELTDRRLRRPLIIAGVVCVAFLHGVPTGGAGGALVAAGLGIGAACGAISARATRVERDERTGRVVATASRLAVAVTGGAFAARMAFAVAATHGLGPAIGRLSAELGIRSAQAWVAALVLMAAADLVVRAAILWRRRRGAAGSSHWTRGALVA